MKDSQPSNTESVAQALILVVERNLAVQRLERFLLEQAGYSVEFASDGIAALARARELRPKLVVTELLVLSSMVLVCVARSSRIPASLLGGGIFELLYRSPVEMQLDSVATQIFAHVKEGRIKRIVIDAIGELRKSSSDAQRFSDFMYALTQWFAAQNVTCMLMYELHHLYESVAISDEEVSNMSDNVVLLRFTNDVEMTRKIRIIKTRGSAHDHREHTYEISNRGVAIENA